jgi:galactokinase
VLPVAIDRSVRLTVDDVGGRRIRLTSAHAEGAVDVASDGSEAPSGGWGRYVAAVAAELAELGREPVGLAGHLVSDLPQGSGLSSSAALEVVVAIALTAVADLDVPPLELAAACRRAERAAVGVPSGIMDQAASILGRAGHAVLLDCGTLTHRTVPLPGDHRLVLVDSGVRRELESSGYGDRARELQAALPVLGGRRPAEVDPDELPDLLTQLDPVPARRLRHVVTENARVREVVAALETGDLAAVGALFTAGHTSLRDDFEVSIPELDGLVELARAAGATAARMTGGGFGGAIVTLVRDGEVDGVVEEILGRARQRWPDHAVVAHVCSAVDGAHETTAA